MIYDTAICNGLWDDVVSGMFFMYIYILFYFFYITAH